jgi:uncharacterized protein YqhQ
MLFMLFVAILVYIMYPNMLILDLVLIPVVSLFVFWVHEKLSEWNHNRKMKKLYGDNNNL